MDTQKLLWKFRTEGSPGYFPPQNETFTMTLNFNNRVTPNDIPKKKKYDLDMKEEGEDSTFYKSRLTYQSSTRYNEKRTYQVDSNEDEF